MNNKIVVDIGGSGVKIGILDGDGVFGISRHNVTSVEQLADLIRCAAKGDVSAVGLSVAGFVNAAQGTVRRSAVAPWLEGDLARRLKTLLKTENVAIVNDGEAHALCLLRNPDIRFGAICLSFGTAVGFGIIGPDRKPVRTLSGENWDIGSILQQTRASIPYEQARNFFSGNKPNDAKHLLPIWWLLGSNGFEQLVRDMGSNASGHFGYRLGYFLSQLTILFRPRTIGLTGGIIRNHWDGDMKRNTIAELRQNICLHDVPDVEVIKLAASESALYGAAELITRVTR
jgi:hypothetical protein